MFSYRELLLNELRRRQSTNPMYSLRAFARALDMDPSTLSKILRGKRDLSMRKAFDLTLRLQLPADIVNAFLGSVANESKKTKPSEAEAVKGADPAATAVGVDASSNETIVGEG